MIDNVVHARTVPAAGAGRAVTGYERGAGLAAALSAGFTAIGPLRVGNRRHRRDMTNWAKSGAARP